MLNSTCPKAFQTQMTRPTRLHFSSFLVSRLAAIHSITWYVPLFLIVHRVKQLSCLYTTYCISNGFLCQFAVKLRVTCVMTTLHPCSDWHVLTALWTG